MLSLFHPTGLFQYPQKTCFQGVLKETSGMKWIKRNLEEIALPNSDKVLAYPNSVRAKQAMEMILDILQENCLYTKSIAVKGVRSPLHI